MRFPSTNLTVDQINATGTPLANTGAAFASAAAGEPTPFRVLFYGQSIIGSGWPAIAMAKLQTRHPNMLFHWQNRAIGGFSAEHLVRTTPGDLADISPDLIVFHVYGDHRAYAETIETMLARTGADVILQTDHATEWPEPRCPAGVSLSPATPAGCKGWPLQRQAKWSDYMSFHLIPALAERHGLAVHPVRRAWEERLTTEGKTPRDVLRDTQHLNPKGEAWMAGLFVDFLEARIKDAPTAPRRTRIALPPANPDGSYTIETAADRIEALSRGALGPVSVSVDGTATNQRPECYAHGRASGSLPGHHWPVARQINAQAPLVTETWTLTLSGFSPDYTDFGFTLRGSVTGPDGAGTADSPFRSTSGRVVIDPVDWTPGKLHQVQGFTFADPLVVTWQTRFLCDDVTTIPAPDGEDPFVFTTLATGLGGASATRTVTFTLPADRAGRIDRLLLTHARIP